MINTEIKNAEGILAPGLKEILEGYVERGEIPGLIALVSRNGQVQVETAGTLALGEKMPVQRDSIFRISSMTKPVTAVAAMILVEECKLRLDDPVDIWLPELADRKVLKKVDGPLGETVQASRPITLRDLLTLRMGMGHLLNFNGIYPIQLALKKYGILQGPPKPQNWPSPDKWIKQVGSLPLMYQPGEMWMYDLGLDVLGVLIARAAGQSLETFMQERIFGPLGMKDTAFSVPDTKIGRLATSYMPDYKTGKLSVYDEAKGGHWSQPPAFPMGSAGLVSTVDDFLAFGQMMLDKGRYRDTRILSRPTVELMTTNHLTRKQISGWELFLGESSGWGFGMSVDIKRADLWSKPGNFGWSGGMGSTWGCDPAENLTGILMTQVGWTSPEPPRVCSDFWTCIYRNIE